MEEAYLGDLKGKYSKATIEGFSLDIKENGNLIANFRLLFTEISRLLKSATSDIIEIEELAHIYLTLREEVEGLAEENKDVHRIELIDKYMRMFFDAVIFTRIVPPEKGYHLLTDLEKKIILCKLHGTRYEVTKKKKRIQELIEDIEKKKEVLDKFSQEKYRNEIQMKQLFKNITHVGLICNGEKEQYLIAFRQIRCDDQMNSLLKIALLLSAGILQCTNALMKEIV